MKNKFRAKRFGWLIALATLFVGIVIIATLLTRGTEQVTKADDTMTQIGYLYCYTNNPTDAFFEARSQLNVKHEIKYTFSEQGSDKASYTYTGSFETPEYAEMSMADLHADYNTYMGKAGVYQESLYPTWNVIGNNAVINLFIDKEH